MKIVGSCLFYLVHLDNKKLQEVNLYVAWNDGSVQLSCTKTLVLVLIQPNTRLDFYHQTSLITSSVDYPKKTKRVSVYSSRKEASTQSLKQEFTVSDQQPLLSKLVTSKEHISQS